MKDEPLKMGKDNSVNAEKARRKVAEVGYLYGGSYIEPSSQSRILVA